MLSTPRGAVRVRVEQISVESGEFAPEQFWQYGQA
jgi:hypothetical protein